MEINRGREWKIPKNYFSEKPAILDQMVVVLLEAIIERLDEIREIISQK